MDAEQYRANKECRKNAVHHLAEGKGHLPGERRNEPAEKSLCEQLMKRAKGGEHFPPSVHHR
jgi:hypothetical protein